jgi:TPP-dependent pyruvate/acetoin dehydrogenase alpha subunit
VTELAVLYERMVRIRVFEDEILRLFLQNKVEGTTHLYQGQEAISVGVCSALASGDKAAATYRGHGAALALGSDPAALAAEILGRATGTCGGRAGTMNIIDLRVGLIGCFGIVGGSIAAATGSAFGSQLAGDGAVAVAFFGDGAVNQAYFHECLNLAAVRRLPVVYVCENNLYAEWTSMRAVTAGGTIAERGAAFGIPSTSIDGNDVHVVVAAATAAVARARSGNGPSLLECRTYRHKGHSKVDPGHYRPKEEVEEWLERDPLLRVAAKLGEEAGRIYAAVSDEIMLAIERAQASGWPEPDSLAAPTKEAA